MKVQITIPVDIDISSEELSRRKLDKFKQELIEFTKNILVETIDTDTSMFTIPWSRSFGDPKVTILEKQLIKSIKTSKSPDKRLSNKPLHISTRLPPDMKMLYKGRYYKGNGRNINRLKHFLTDIYQIGNYVVSTEDLVVTHEKELLAKFSWYANTDVPIFEFTDSKKVVATNKTQEAYLKLLLGSDFRKNL